MTRGEHEFDDDPRAGDAAAPGVPPQVSEVAQSEPDVGPARPWWGEPWGEGGADVTAASAAVPPAGGDTEVLAADGGGNGGHQRHRRGMRTPLLVLAVIAGIVLFTGIGAAIGVKVGDDGNSNNADLTVNKSAKTATAPVVTASGTTNVEAVAAAVQPAVVSISERTSQLEGTGSGVVIDATHGYILTNNHVVSAAAAGRGKIVVTTNDGRDAPGTIIGRDPSSDIAVVQIELDNLTQAQIGDSDGLKVGQTVVAFGSPLGLQGTVTSGIVSALDRPVSTEDSSDGSASTQATIDAIQTDAAINPGNSGGPLVDGAGKVIGINSAIATTGTSVQGSESGNIGVGFAIPINEAMDTAEQIIKTGHAVHPIIGASVSGTQDGSSGALIRALNPGGPAQRAGLQVGDVIVGVGGKKVADPDATIVAVRKNHDPGDKITITYLRSGQQHEVTVTLAASTPTA
ncbi:MAG TPA: trypsin-like peptidase domain-containing protein [Mycobacteriales bacterium]|nr:trypsin-like peptidase domain-containing protein [Mycobacteriales bacterium]